MRFLLLLGMFGLLVLVGCGGSTTTSPGEMSDNPFAAVTVGTDTTLEVVTWNLENFAKNGSTTVELVVQAVEGMDADIIGLQEIGSSSRFAALIAALEGWTGRLMATSYGFNLAYIYRVDGPLQIESIQELFADDGSAFPRSPLLLLGRFDGEPIAVLNNHLKCCGDGTLDMDDYGDEENRRHRANIQLKGYADEHLADRRVFIIGDFNDELTDRTSDNVFNIFLEDPDGWHIADMDIAEGNATGWSFPGWPSHLDHIICNFDAVDLVQVVPLDDHINGGWPQYDENISDHLPVAVRINPGFSRTRLR